MHSNGLFLKDVAGFLGSYYTGLAVMNAVAAFLLWRRRNQPGLAVPVDQTAVSFATMRNILERSSM